MTDLSDNWRALSIRQPWIEMILAGEKIIEVREWEYPPRLRGAFILHAAWGIDWKTVDLLQIAPSLLGSRGAFVGCAELVDVIELSSATNWRERLLDHRVIHPPKNDRTVQGLVLRNVRRFRKPVRGRGSQYFFPIPPALKAPVGDQLSALGQNPGETLSPTS